MRRRSVQRGGRGVFYSVLVLDGVRHGQTRCRPKKQLAQLITATFEQPLFSFVLPICNLEAAKPYLDQSYQCFDGTLVQHCSCLPRRPARWRNVFKNLLKVMLNFSKYY